MKKLVLYLLAMSIVGNVVQAFFPKIELQLVPYPVPAPCVSFRHFPGDPPAQRS